MADHLPLFHHQDAVHHLVEEIAVVRDDERRALEFRQWLLSSTSAEAMSRLLVGSSSSRKLALESTTSSNCSRLRSPPESAFTFCAHMR